MNVIEIRVTAGPVVEVRSGDGPAVDVSTTQSAEVQIATTAAPGLQGPVGGVLTRVAGVALGAGRAVRVRADNKAVYADPADPLACTACGVTEGAASIDAPATIRAAGLLADAAWNWLEGPIYCGANGMLTQVPPVSGTLVQMGVAAGPDAMIVNPEFLADLAA